MFYLLSETMNGREQKAMCGALYGFTLEHVGGEGLQSLHTCKPHKRRESSRERESRGQMPSAHPRPAPSPTRVQSCTGGGPASTLPAVPLSLPSPIPGSRGNPRTPPS